jgi:hypothetical protein
MHLVFEGGKDTTYMHIHTLDQLLFQAVQDQLPTLVKRALSEGADPNSSDTTGQTPLMHAARLGDLVIVQLLLAAGADVWHQSPDGQIPLIYTNEGSHVEVARVIGTAMRTNADPQWLREALAQFADGDYALVAGLLAAGIDGSGFPLLVAIQSGNPDIVAEFLKTNIDVNLGNTSTTPLVHAASGGHREIVRMLLAAGADVNQRAPNGKTPLQAAQERRKKGIPETDWQAIIRLLRAGGATDTAEHSPAP